MSNSVEDIYNKLISDESDFLNAIDYGSDYNSDDDEEDFLTSKELVKQKELLESEFGERAPLGHVDIEEDVHYKRYSTRRVHKYTETEMAEIRESCKATIVHDYGEHDIYHQSDEERKENDMLADISVKLGGLRRSYSQVDQYVRAMRVVVEAWELLEANNFIHTEDEFFQMVAEGRIVSGRIIMPKLKKADRYNMDLIIKYISNPELDPKDLVMIKPKKSSYDEFDTDEDDPDTILYNSFIDEYIAKAKEEAEENGEEFIDNYRLMHKAAEYANEKMEEIEMERLLSADEAKFILDNIDNPPALTTKEISHKLVKGYDRRDLRSKKRKVSKKEKYAAESLHDILNKIQMNPENREEAQYSRSYMLTHGMFDVEKQPKDFWDDLRFDGSWASDTDVWLYDIAVREELMKQPIGKDRYKTFGDKDLLDFFTTLEAHGVNTVDLRRKMDCEKVTSESIAEKAKKKENKKIEAQLLSRITELNKSKKFKKIVGKAEKALNEQLEIY